MTTRQVYLEELTKLKSDVIRMGSMLENSLDRVIEALNNQDTKLAKKIMADDDKIDDMERAIEEECIDLIARQQPVATDLREITSVMRIISDLERIADHCADISEYIIRAAKEKMPMPKQIGEMVEAVSKMIRMAIDAYINADAEAALKIIKKDDKVDELFEEIREDLFKSMKRHPDRIRAYGDYLMIIKYLERMADHCSNIAGWINFVVTGKLR